MMNLTIETIRVLNRTATEDFGRLRQCWKESIWYLEQNMNS